MNWWDLTRQVCARLDAADIPYCLLRQPKEALTDEQPGDIDLLTSPQALESLYDTLDAYYCLSPISFIQNHAQIIVTDTNSGQSVKLDIHTELFCGYSGGLFSLNIHEEVLNTRSLCDGVYRPIPAYGLYLLAIHLLMDKRAVVVKHLENIRAEEELYSKNKNEIIPLWSALLTPTIAKKMWDGLFNGDRQVLCKIRKRLYLHFSLKKPIETLFRIPKVQIRARSYLKIWPLHRPFTVALLGPDGVGKSTLTDQLGAIDGFKTKYMGNREGTLPTSKFILSTYKRRNRKQRNKSTSSPASENTNTIASNKREFSLKDITTRPVIWLNSFFELYAKYLAAVFSRGTTVIIFDRYPYDSIARSLGKQKVPWFGRIRNCITLNFYPSPDLMISLYAPTEILFSRKQEQSMQILEDLNRGYANLVKTVAESAKVSVTTVTTTSEVEYVVSRIYATIQKERLAKLKLKKWL